MMRLTLFYLTGAIALLTATSYAAPRCERLLLLSDSVITLEGNPKVIEGFKVRVQTPSLGEATCPTIPRNQQRIVQRHIGDLNQKKNLSVDRLIGFIASPWRSLSNSAGQKLTKQLGKSQASLTNTHVTRLVRLVVTNQINPSTGQMIVRLVSKLPASAAVPALASILKQGTGLSVQRAAARALGRFPSKEAHAALKTCARGVDRMLSARCERSLIRWATQQTQPSNVSRPERTQP